MPDRVLFLTGHLAERRLRKVLTEMNPTEFSWEIRDVGVQVAALMTTDLIRRRLPFGGLAADRVFVPGHCSGDLAELGTALGVPVERAPEDLHDIPAYFGRARLGVDLERHAVRIFAEIVDAARLPVEQIVARARSFA